MIFYMLAIALLVLGGTIVTLQVLRKPSPFGFLVERGIDPHLWGFHFMGAGFLLSLLLLTFRQTPWNDLDALGRVIAASAALWVIAAPLLSTIAVLIRDRAGSVRPLIPSPDATLRMWPVHYRAFLGLGFVALEALAVITF
ncbi:MAG TPA: hypothetical protein VFP10_10655 [Candidatus Eisenbacteria bacterium]|nr:hypothetical protein [Candidatus Eisenbacteria bacterium]